MRKTIGQVLAFLLTATLLFSAAAIAARADADDAGVKSGENVLVTIAMDKPSYAATDVAKVTVTVENKSGQALDDVIISAEAEKWLLTRDSDPNDYPVGDLEAGETREMSLRCVLDFRAPGVRFFDRVRLLFRNVFVVKPRSFRAVNHPGKRSAVSSALVTHGGAAVTITATAWYGPEQDDVISTLSGKQALESGVLSYVREPDADFCYIEDSPRMRSLGAAALHNWAAAVTVSYYDTWRAHFEYDGLEWMIQAWKGQYGFLYVGSEICVYNRAPQTIVAEPYRGAEDDRLIPTEMSVDLDAHDGNGYQKLFTRAYAPHWWTNGFMEGHLAEYKFNDRSCLIQTARLTMADQEMLDAFTDALENEVGFKRVDSVSDVSADNPDVFAVSGLDVCYAWKTIDQGYKTRY